MFLGGCSGNEVAMAVNSKVSCLTPTMIVMVQVVNSMRSGVVANDV